MKAPVTTAVAILTGLLVLLGYIVPALQPVQAIVLGWAIVLVGVAAVIGIINLVVVHVHKATQPPKRDPFSMVFLVAFLLTLAAAAVLEPSSPEFQRIMLAIQVPVESSLMALLAVVLAFTSLRLLQRRKGTLSILFLISAVLFLILGSGFLTSTDLPSPIKEIIAFANRLPSAGGRGILLGIALGSLTAGLRVLLGADRPYRG
jgi:hypothetical protein